MKKLKNLFKILLVLLILTISTKAYAASASLSVSSGSVYVGDSFTATITVNAASWDVQISSTGPVSNCSIHQADASADALNTSRTFTANCVTTGEGTINVTLSGNVTGESDDYATNVSGSRSVTVVKKEEPAPTPTPDNSNNNNNNNNNNQENKPEEQKSNNNKLSGLSIEGYELVKVDDNNYTLSVKNDVSKININATAADSKSTISGTGEHVLTVGENTIEVICKAEDGTENKITIKVTREEKKKDDTKKDDTKKNTTTPTKTTDKKESKKFNYILILSLILNAVLLVFVIILLITLKKKKSEPTISEAEPIEFLDTNN